MAFGKLYTLLAEQFGVEETAITPETSLADDLGADALEMTEVLMILEETFDVGEIDEATAADIHTVGDILRLIGKD